MSARVPATLVDDRGAVLSGVALNAAAATRTATILRLDKRYSRIILTIDYTYSAATTVTVTPSASPNTTSGGTTYGRKTSTAIASGAGTVSLYADTYTTSAASATFELEYDCSGRDAMKFVFGGAGAGAGDLITVYAVAVAG